MLIEKSVLNYTLYSELKLSQNIMLPLTLPFSHLCDIYSHSGCLAWLTYPSLEDSTYRCCTTYRRLLITIIHSLIHTFKQQLWIECLLKELDFRFSCCILSNHALGTEPNTNLCRRLSRAKYWATYFNMLFHLIFITTSVVSISTFILQKGKWDSNIKWLVQSHKISRDLKLSFGPKSSGSFQ